MSFRERPPEREPGQSTREESSDELTEPLEDPPTPAPTGVVGRLRYHVATWPGRFVEMQTEAFGGRTH
ncbi:hypothetical protein [Haloarchaeobius sp. DFWS5]|uniref:hypothetical protein n=1 Tax=Haloarchaeobius sp. DFWS5 TaxID=3446114 RepID=UPI003EB84D4B